MNLDGGALLTALIGGVVMFALARLSTKIDKIDEKLEQCIRRDEYDENCKEHERWKREYVSIRFHRLANICHAMYLKLWPDRDPPNFGADR